MMAVFGEQMAVVFMKLHEARAAIQVASEALANDVFDEEDRERLVQL
jgi:hypothetical protein